MAKLSASTVTINDGDILLSQRARSSAWQAKFKIGSRWVRVTTKQDDLEKAKKAAKELFVEYKFKEKHQLPVRALRPQAFIIEAWDSAHPVVSTLQNFESTLLYPGNRDIFATAMQEGNRIANKDVRKMKSTNGHVVVRVAPGGETFQIFVTTNADESDRVVGVHGPYRCA